MIVFWVVGPCSLVEITSLMMEAARTSETLAIFDQTTRRNNQEGSHLHARSHENLKSHKWTKFLGKILQKLA
jgi:hypothetical protein